MRIQPADRDRTWGAPQTVKIGSPRFLGSPNPGDEFQIRHLFGGEDPFFETIHYPHLKLAIASFERVEKVDLFDLSGTIYRIKTHPKLETKVHKQFSARLDSILGALKATEMFYEKPTKPLDFRQQKAAAAGKQIAGLADGLDTPYVSGYQELKDLWLLALSVNKQNEMAVYTAMWGALQSPPGKNRDMITALAIQHPSREVRRLATHGVNDIQNPETRAAAIGRMSLDADALIRMRADILKSPMNPFNWLMSFIIFRSPSY